jgi:hypothetical protein
MPLESLDASGTKITDLSPLSNLPLTKLWVNGTGVRDLMPIRKLPLEHLGCRGISGRNLKPLAGMPVVSIEIDFGVADIREVLDRMPNLKSVNGRDVEVWRKGEVPR